MKLRIHTDFHYYVMIQVRCEGSKLVRELSPWSPFKHTEGLFSKTGND